MRPRPSKFRGRLDGDESRFTLPSAPGHTRAVVLNCDIASFGASQLRGVGATAGSRRLAGLHLVVDMRLI